MITLKLNDNWDLYLNSNGDLAIDANDSAPCQDACSYCQTWAGEVMFDQTLGLPYDKSILTATGDVQQYAQDLSETAKTVPRITNAVAKLGTIGTNRKLSGLLAITLDTGDNRYVIF